MRAYFERRKLRRELRELASHAVAQKAMREDLLPAQDLARLDQALADARAAYRTGGAGELRAAAEALSGVLHAVMPSKPLAAWRNNFEVLVVALSVAATEMLLNTKLDPETHRRLVREYIDSLGEMPHA